MLLELHLASWSSEAALQRWLLMELNNTVLVFGEGVCAKIAWVLIMTCLTHVLSSLGLVHVLIRQHPLTTV